MNAQKYSLPPIDGLLSFPTKEVMQYGLDHQLLDSPGLPMHIMLGRMTVDALASALPKTTEFDIDTARSLTTVYHATRQAADYGKVGKHSDPKVNEFMQTHGDMEYALLRAEENGLSPAIVEGIRHYIINPAHRESGYFPHETLSKNGQINWTEAIPMLTSWLVAGVLTRTDKRFDDLRTRRSAEIGKLELPHWKMKIEAGESVSLPQPIVDIAIKDSTYATEDDIIKGIQSGVVTDAIMGKWILDGYEEWANHVIGEYSRLTGIDDFYAFLEHKMDTIGDAEPEKKEKIKNEFELMLGRQLNSGEFIPYVDGIDLLFKRMRGLKTKETQERYKKRVETIMRNIEKVVKRLAKKPNNMEGMEIKQLAIQLSCFRIRPNPNTRREEIVLVIIPGEGPNISELVLNDQGEHELVFTRWDSPILIPDGLNVFEYIQRFQQSEVNPNMKISYTVSGNGLLLHAIEHIPKDSE